MSFTIKRLGPEHAEIFVEFFESLNFDHSPHWSSCYCMAYHLDCSQERWHSRTGSENRRDALNMIKQGKMKGYLAFAGEKCVGWCNANDVQQYRRLKNEIQHLQGQRVGCVICFVVHPDYRRQGVSKLLLEHAVHGFRADGYEAVLALPMDIKGSPQKQYRGPVNLYTEFGFEEIERSGDLRVMWLDLQED